MTNLVPTDPAPEISPTPETSSVKERVAANLKQAKGEGSLRAERIRDIVQQAAAQAIVELKAGSQEVRPVVKDTLSGVVEILGVKGKEVQHDLSAAIEGLVEGISQSRRKNLASTESQIKQLQAQVDHETQLLEAEVDSTLTEIQETGKASSTDLNSLIESAVQAVKEKEEFSMLRQQYARLKHQLETLEEKLEAKYGDRYDEAKRHLENAKTWYDETKVEAKAQGTDPLQKKQVEIEAKMAEAGAAIARKEKEVKQLLREFLHSVNSKR